MTATHSPPATIAPASLFSSTATTNDHSPLVSATTQQYGRVIINRETLISKIGLKAAQRAIRRSANNHHQQRQHQQQAKPYQHTAYQRTTSIAKWLESADDESDQEEHTPARERRVLCDPMSLFCSPHKPQNKQLHPPSTPPNQPTQTEQFRQHPPLSQLSFAIQPGQPSSTFQRMLKPGCNLSQAFLLRPPSPTIGLSTPTATGDENQKPCNHNPSSSPPHKNHFSPCSPLRNDLLKLIDHHQQTPTKTNNSITTPPSTHHHHHSLTDRDSNSSSFSDPDRPDSPFLLVDPPLDNNFLSFF